MILMKNAIITYSDAKYGDFLIDNWLRSLKATNDLKNIEVIVIDYGLTKEQADKLKKEDVLVFKFKKDGFPSCIRFRDMLQILGKNKYDQVMTTDGGDIIFQSDINFIFRENNKDYRGVCEPFSPPFEKLFMLAFDKADAEKMKKVVTGKRLVNAGMIVAPYKKFLALCEECDSLIKKRVFGPDMIAVNYILYRDGFKELESKYNFIITTSKEDFYVKDSFFYLADGSLIPIVHNAGGKDFFRPVINFGYGKGFNTKRRSFFLIKGIVKAMHSTGKIHDRVMKDSKSPLMK